MIIKLYDTTGGIKIFEGYESVSIDRQHDCTTIFASRKNNVAEKPCDTISVTNLAYICNDEGKTIEKVWAKDDSFKPA